MNYYCDNTHLLPRDMSLKCFAGLVLYVLTWLTFPAQIHSYFSFRLEAESVQVMNYIDLHFKALLTKLSEWMNKLFFDSFSFGL